MNDVVVSGAKGDDTLTASMFAVGTKLNSLYAQLRGDQGNDNLRISLALDGGEKGQAYAALDGGTGADKLWIGVTSETSNQTIRASGEEGDDHIRINSSALGIATHGQQVSIFASGGPGNDRISATLSLTGNDVDSIFRLSGDAGDDHLTATLLTPDLGALGAGTVLKGGAGGDRLSVTGGMGNVLDGGTGADVLIGGSGTDRLIGGAGIDTLIGGGGEDVFIFRTAGAGRDRIKDFVHGDDRIDLSDIDANVFRAGNQRFAFGEGDGTGRMWVEDDPHGNGSLLHADTGRAVLTIAFLDGHGVEARDYTSADFIL